jgi:hypothetical protein
MLSLMPRLNYRLQTRNLHNLQPLPNLGFMLILQISVAEAGRAPSHQSAAAPFMNPHLPESWKEGRRFCTSTDSSRNITFTDMIVQARWSLDLRMRRLKSRHSGWANKALPGEMSETLLLYSLKTGITALRMTPLSSLQSSDCIFNLRPKILIF